MCLDTKAMIKEQIYQLLHCSEVELNFQYISEIFLPSQSQVGGSLLMKMLVKRLPSVQCINML